MTELASSTPLTNLITGTISFLLTVMVLTYLIGDNPAFRVAIFIFIGVSAGYAASVAWHQVIYPQLVLPLRVGSLAERLLALFPLVMGFLLLFKLWPRRASLGNVSMAFLVGVGAAVAVGGAVMGTLFPQTLDSMNAFNLSTAGTSWFAKLSEGIVMLIGTISTLVYFHYGAKATPQGPERWKPIRMISWVGQIFIAITFGVLFSGVFVAAMTALIERLSFIVTYLSSFLIP
jgi:hypothetical protein